MSWLALLPLSRSPSPSRSQPSLTTTATWNGPLNSQWLLFSTSAKARPLSGTVWSPIIYTLFTLLPRSRLIGMQRKQATLLLLDVLTVHPTPVTRTASQG